MEMKEDLQRERAGSRPIEQGEEFGMSTRHWKVKGVGCSFHLVVLHTIGGRASFRARSPHLCLLILALH